LSDAQAAHRAFLNRYYAFSRPFYDVTRKYYLLGRDPTIRSLASDLGWRRLVEIGPGTGRNLTLLHRDRADAILGGVEASDEMLAHAKARCPWATLEHGFAEDAPVGALLGEPPDRVLFSYCLSMVRDPERAIANARRSLAVGGQVVVVDFGDLTGLPAIVARSFRAYLRAFHVQPLGDAILADATERYDGPGRYYVVARFGESGNI
jgi:S-adenosylmethionine-diacylgycerolhomoserine-N-methlytransferase